MRPQRLQKRQPVSRMSKATRRAAEDDLGVWRKVHWQAKNYSTVPAVYTENALAKIPWTCL